jgi:hypothetical protein
MSLRGAGARMPRERSAGRAAGLAALAEASGLALPVHLLVTGAGPATIGPGAFAAVFLPLFAGAAWIVAARRDRAWITGALAGASLAAGLWLGLAGFGAVGVTLPVTLLLGWLIALVGLRDPVTPMGTSFVIVTLALGVESILATGAQPSWSAPLVALIPIAFCAALVSRATTTWSEGDAREVAADARHAWIGRSLRASVGLVAGVLAVAALAVRGGILDRFAAWLAPVGNVLASVFVWIAAQAARPFLWLAERANLDPEGVRRALSRLQRDVDQARRATERQATGGSGVGRVLGFLLLSVVVVALVLVIRRRRPTIRSFGRAAQAPGTVTVSTGGSDRPDVARPGHVPLPADRVRRWYAEALVGLARSGMAKDPSATPAEFRDDVAHRIPRIAEGFADLTEAYQEVRYGAAVLDAATLDRLRATHRHLTRELRRPTPVRDPPHAEPA